MRNQISGGAVVIGPVVQAGTFTGQIHHHGDERQPLGLLALWLWAERVATDYRAMVERTGDRTAAAHVRQVDLVRAARIGAEHVMFRRKLQYRSANWWSVGIRTLPYSSAG
ncbi:hypothetical protein ACPZ19_49755 [Amycolatopsis lurida]